MYFKKSIYLLCFLGCFFIQKSYSQFEIPKKPEFQTSVYDYAKILSVSEKQALESKLIRYSDTTSTQIVIATIKSLNNEDIGILTPRWAHKWGIGQEREDNGVFILLAEKDRKIWISPGYGVEHKLTAGITGQLVRNVIIPEFKRGSYYRGLDKGSDAVFQVLNGEYQGTRKQNSEDFSILPIILFIIFITILFILISRGNKGNGGGNNRRNYRRDRRTKSILETIILSNSGRSSGGFGGFGGSSSGGSFGGGGFGGGFGGGGFSGGGAGGGW